MRVVGFFLYCFASILAPIGIGFGLLLRRGSSSGIGRTTEAVDAR